MVTLKENERIDDLERNGYRIIQNKSRFCFGMDAVLLSGFAADSLSGKRKLKIADLGTGTGIIPLLVEARLKENAEKIDALEIQPEMCDMARRSVELNGLSEKIRITEGDIKSASDIFGRGVFDAVTSNPPYIKNAGGIINPDDSKAIARHEVLCSFRDVAESASAILKPGGRFFLVHRPDRLAEIIITLNNAGLQPKVLKMVHSFMDSEATLFLLEAIKGGNFGMKVLKPLIIYKEVGKYTDEIYDIYGF